VAPVANKLFLLLLLLLLLGYYVYPGGLNEVDGFAAQASDRTSLDSVGSDYNIIESMEHDARVLAALSSRSSPSLLVALLLPSLSL